MEYKILFSNIGYARGINGFLRHHLLYSYRYLYCSQIVQEQSLKQLKEIISFENPDICCLIEIDTGSASSANFNQLGHLINANYNFFDIENKYRLNSWLRTFHHTRGKSSAVIAKRPLICEYLHFVHGIKTLIYKISLEEGLTLFFAHFSLKRRIRNKQLQEIRHMIDNTQGEIILMGDFNILVGLEELKPLLEKGDLVLLNREEEPTFTFHKHRLLLDLCICSRNIAKNTELKIIPQPFSDHSALLLKIS